MTLMVVENNNSVGVGCNSDEVYQQMVTMFPEIEGRVIEEVVKQCKGDLEEIVRLLTDPYEINRIKTILYQPKLHNEYNQSLF